MEFGTLPQTIVLSSLPSEQSKWLSHFFAISTHPPPVMHLNYLHFNATKCKYVPPSETSKRTNKQLWINSASQHTQSLRILNASNVKHWILFEIKKRHSRKIAQKMFLWMFVALFFSFIFDWLQTITIRIRATRQTNLVGCAFANGIIFINFIFAIW